MEKLLNEFLECKIFAVAGSFSSPEKYAYKIVQFLLKKGKKVYPVNPNIKEVLGQPCFSEIAFLPEKPDVVNLVTPPEATEKIVKECKEMGIKRVWMQPGAECEEAIDFCGKNGIKAVYNSCILLQ